MRKSRHCNVFEYLHIIDMHVFILVLLYGVYVNAVLFHIVTNTYRFMQTVPYTADIMLPCRTILCSGRF